MTTRPGRTLRLTLTMTESRDLDSVPVQSLGFRPSPRLTNVPSPRSWTQGVDSRRWIQKKLNLKGRNLRRRRSVRGFFSIIQSQNDYFFTAFSLVAIFLLSLASRSSASVASWGAE